MRGQPQCQRLRIERHQRAESVRKFAVLDTQFTQENKCLTPSLKVVRPAVNRVFADVIDNEIYNGKR